MLSLVEGTDLLEDRSKVSRGFYCVASTIKASSEFTSELWSHVNRGFRSEVFAKMPDGGCQLIDIKWLSQRRRESGSRSSSFGFYLIRVLGRGPVIRLPVRELYRSG